MTILRSTATSSKTPLNFTLILGLDTTFTMRKADGILVASSRGHQSLASKRYRQPLSSIVYLWNRDYVKKPTSHKTSSDNNPLRYLRESPHHKRWLTTSMLGLMKRLTTFIENHDHSGILTISKEWLKLQKIPIYSGDDVLRMSSDGNPSFAIIMIIIKALGL